jgi:hypothetical protein
MTDRYEYSVEDAVSTEGACLNHSEDRLEAAMGAANIDTAIALWNERDWRTYVDVRDSLLTLLRSGRKEKMTMEHLHFIYFVNAQLRPRFSSDFSEKQVFENSVNEDCSGRLDVTDCSSY